MEPTTCGTATWQTPHHKFYNRGGTFPTKKGTPTPQSQGPNCKAHQEHIQNTWEKLRVTIETLRNSQI